MPIFSADLPYDRAQRVRRWVIGIFIVVTGVAIAIWAAIDCSHIIYGYVASYTFAEIFYLSILIALVGIPLIVYWRTRSTGVVLIATGVLMYAIFLGTIGVLKKFDKVAWVHEPPMQHFGPDQPVSLVIYYKAGTTNDQIEDFIENRLEQPAEPRHAGKDYPEFVAEYMRLSTEQSNGFDGSALTFVANTSETQSAPYIAMIEADPRVQRVFRNVIPNSIHLPSSEQAPKPIEHKARHTQ
jgi:hypothetical protein